MARVVLILLAFCFLQLASSASVNKEEKPRRWWGLISNLLQGQRPPFLQPGSGAAAPAGAPVRNKRSFFSFTTPAPQVQQSFKSAFESAFGNNNGFGTPNNGFGNSFATPASSVAAPSSGFGNSFGTPASSVAAPASNFGSSSNSFNNFGTPSNSFGAPASNFVTTPMPPTSFGNYGNAVASYKSMFDFSGPTPAPSNTFGSSFSAPAGFGQPSSGFGSNNAARPSLANIFDSRLSV